MTKAVQNNSKGPLTGAFFVAGINTERKQKRGIISMTFMELVNARFKPFDDARAYLETQLEKGTTVIAYTVHNDGNFILPHLYENLSPFKIILSNGYLVDLRIDMYGSSYQWLEDAPQRFIIQTSKLTPSPTFKFTSDPWALPVGDYYIRGEEIYQYDEANDADLLEVAIFETPTFRVFEFEDHE